MLPQFEHVIQVADDQSDAELKAHVTENLQDLAFALQAKVYQLCPEAEGTVSWDGFGARAAYVK